METIVDHLDTVNSNSFLGDIKNPEKIENLIIKNYNTEVKWSDLEKFTNIKEIKLINCLVDNFPFFSSISKKPFNKRVGLKI